MLSSVLPIPLPRCRILIGLVLVRHQCNFTAFWLRRGISKSRPRPYQDRALPLSYVSELFAAGEAKVNRARPTLPCHIWSRLRNSNP